jgi:hypothetical protein
LLRSDVPAMSTFLASPDIPPRVMSQTARCGGGRRKPSTDAQPKREASDESAIAANFVETARDTVHRRSREDASTGT